MSQMRLIVERDEAGRSRTTYFKKDKIVLSENSPRPKNHVHLKDFLAKVFLPAGYPESVSPDYLHYQIFNALQAFCSSLAGLISSRAILEGFGVGDASASATHALLITVLQDIFGRITTILAAYRIGSFLYPEAKTYRLLADILNDSAIILDTLSPLLSSESLQVPFISMRVPGIRVVALCTSASLRALCGIAAGGSKAALTLHFATPHNINGSNNGKGDVGDLNAKDASKETVLSLLGMLLGTAVVPYLTTSWSTYIALFSLVAAHLFANYIAVRGVALRSCNRQRLGIIWTMHQQHNTAMQNILTPAQVSRRERLFERDGLLRDSSDGDKILGHCTIGSTLSSILTHPLPERIWDIFQGERYVLWFDTKCLHPITPGSQNMCVWGPLRLHICLKEGYRPSDQIKAWVHALEVCRLYARGKVSDMSEEEDEAVALIRISYRTVDDAFLVFIEGLREMGWNITEEALMTGPPKATLTSTCMEDLDELWVEGTAAVGEDKKRA